MDLLYSVLLPPATKLGQGYIFTGVCDSVHGSGGQGGLPQCMLGYHPPRQGRPPPPGKVDPPPGKETPWARQTPPQQGRPPWQGGSPWRGRPSLRSASWEIRSTSGRYASYWNAILVLHLPSVLAIEKTS